MRVLHEGVGGGLGHELGEEVVDGHAGAGPDHRDDALGDHHAVVGGAGLPLALHGAGDDRRLGGVEAGEDAAGDGDEEAGDDGLIVEHPGPEGLGLGEEPGLGEAVPDEGAEHGERADEEDGPEEGVDGADDLVHREEGGDDVVEEDDPDEDPEPRDVRRGGGGQPGGEVGRDVDEDGHDQQEEDHQEDGVGLGVPAAEGALGQGGEVGALGAQAHEAGDAVVHGPAEDAADGDDPEALPAELDADDDADDGAHAGDVEQLDEHVLPHRQGDVVDAVGLGVAGRGAVVGAQQALNEPAIGEVAEDEEENAADEPGHSTLLMERMVK